MSRRRRMLDEPTQSDATLLLKVEDLINIAMGPADENVVHFKVLQQVLFILARQMRILETKVEVRVGELQGLAQGAAQWRPRDNMLDGSESSEGLELGHKRSATSVTPSGKRDKRDKAHEAGYRAGAAGTGYQGAPGGYPGAPGGYPGGPAGGPPSAGYTGVPGGPPAAGYPGAPGGPSAAGYPGAPSGPPTAGQSGAPGGPPAAGHPGAPGGPPAAGYPGAPGGTTAAGYPGAPGAPGGPPAAGYPGAPGAPGGPPTALQPGVPGGPPTAGQPGAPGGPPTAGYPGAPGGPPSAEYPGAPGAPGGPPAAGYPGAPGGPSAAGYPGGPGAPGGPSAAGYPGGPGDPGGPPTAGYPGAPGGQPAGYPPGAGYPDGVAGAPGAGYPGGVAGAPGTGYPDGAAGAPGAGYPGGVAGAPGAGYPGGVAGAPGAGYPSGVAGAPGADYPGGVAGAPGAGYPGGVAGAPGAGYPGGVAGAPGAGYPGGVAGAPGAGYPGGVAGAPGAGYPDGVAGAPGAGYPGGVAGAPGAGYPGGVAGAPGAGYPGGLAGAPGVGYPSGALAPVGGPGTIAAYPGGAPGAVGRTGSITGMSQSPAGGRARIGSIEVVTAKEFALLESAVKALLEKASVPPLPKLPDNKQLRSDIVKGSASLTDTMQAMQLGARVQAAEKAIENMAEMLARLAASGSLPPEVAAQAAAIQGSVQAALQDVNAIMARGGYGGGPGGPGGALTGGPGRGPGGPQGAWTGGPGGGPGGPEGAWAGGPGGGPGGPSGPGGPWTGGPGGGPGGPQGALTGGPGGGPGGPGGAWTGGPGGGPGGPGGAWTGGPGGGPGGPEGAWAGGPGGGPGGSRGAPGGGMEGKGGEGAKGVKGVPSQAAWTGGPGGGPGPGDQWVGGPGGAPGVGPGGQWVGGPEGGQGGVPGVRWGGGPGKAPGEFPGPAETTAQGPQKRPGGGQVSAKIPAHKLAPVTVADLDEAMSMLRDDIVKSMQQMTSRATNAADTASNNVKAIMDKLDTAIHLDTRLTFLQDMVNDYAEQLAGFDSGLSTQMTSFQDQMVTMRIDLQAGLAQLEQVNNNAETAAILELNERYEGLVTELDDTLHSHQGLTTFQRQLTEELKGLMETAEMMREQKADRDEVLDGLRDKADNSRLAGLLSEEDFEKAREELEMRIQMCYDKFRKQDAVWMKVINDFSEAIDSKAEITHLLGLREDVQDELQNLNLKVQQLAKLLGDPKAALLIRKLAKDGTCAVCRVPALMEPVEPTQPVALPRAVPFVRPEPTGAPAEEEEEICLRHFNLKEVMGPPSPREEPHMCQRWVGGSHTMMGAAKGMGHVGREIAPSMLAAPRPVKHFLGEGVDGKFYKLEEDYVPCVECNQFAPEKEPSGQKIPGEAEEAPIQDGSGDQGVTRSHVTVVDPATAARRITVVDDRDLRDAADASHRDSGGNAGPRKSALSTRRSSLGTRQSRVSGQELGDEMYPKMEVRISRMQRSAVILELDAKAHDVEIGQSVQGHVTIQDEKKAELETIKHQLEEASSKSDMHMKTEQVKAEEIEEAEKRTEEGAGRGDAPEPPPASALAEETPKE